MANRSDNPGDQTSAAPERAGWRRSRLLFGVVWVAALVVGWTALRLVLLLQFLTSAPVKETVAAFL